MDVIELLMYFNLTRQEATIYITLYKEGEVTGYEVAKKNGISRSNTYASLASLVEKGAAYSIEGNAMRFTAVPIEEFCTNKIRQLEQIKGILTENMPDKYDESEGYITIKGEENIINKMKNMLLGAKERVYISVSRQIINTLLEEIRTGILKGLKIVIITDMPLELNGAKVYNAEKHQHQIRLIVDSTKVLTGDISAGKDSTCLYSKKKNLVELFKDSLTNEIKLIEMTRG